MTHLFVMLPHTGNYYFTYVDSLVFVVVFKTFLKSATIIQCYSGSVFTEAIIVIKPKIRKRLHVLNLLAILDKALLVLL